MFEKMPPAKSRPRVRSCTMACDEHSMKQYAHPASAISRIIAFRRIESGVVWVASTSRPSILQTTVEISPAL